MRIHTMSRRSAAAMAFLTSLGWSISAAAATITARTEGQVGGVAHQDMQGPATTGAILSRVDFDNATGIDLMPPASALAAQNVDGIAAVRVDGAYTAAGDNQLFAETRWTETVVNGNAIPVAYSYIFFVVPPKLTLFDNAPTVESATSCRWQIEVRLNGNILFQSEAELSGGGHGHELVTSGTPFGHRFFTDGAGLRTGYDFGAFESSLPLGIYNPGQSLTVETILRASSRTVEPGRGARAEIGDPLDLDGVPGISAIIMIDEPLAVSSRSWSAVKSLYSR